MAENVPSRALRGLGNALELIGDRSAPPGIELGLPGQPIHDVTPYVQYGAAQVFEHFADGWVSLAAKETNALATFKTLTISDWSAVVSGDFGVSLNRLQKMALWIYHVSLQTVNATALVDSGVSHVQVNVPIGMSVQSGDKAPVDIWNNDGTVASQSAALTAFYNNQARTRFPLQWAAGADMKIHMENVNANSVVWNWNFLCRMLPLGVPPLP